MTYGPERVPGHICAPEWIPGRYGHLKGDWTHMVLERYPGSNGKRNGIRAHISTGMLPGTYGHQNGAWAHLGTEMVSGPILAPEWCSGNYGH